MRVDSAVGGEGQQLVTVVMFGLSLSAWATSPVVTPPVSATACGPGGTADVDATRVIVQAPAGTDYAPGTAIGLALPPEHTYFFDAETGEAQLHRERLTL